MKKIFVAFALVILFSGVVSASLIATIGMQGLNMVHPGAATAVRAVLCVTSPAGVIGCVEQYVEGKIVGFISGEVLQAIAEISPGAAKAIITYNQVKSYIDTGAEIIEELSVNEKGEIEDGLFEFNEEEYAIGNWVGDLNPEDVSVSNTLFYLENKELITKDDAVIKLKTKNEEGNVIELVYENIRGGGFFRLSENGTIDEADFFSSKDDSIYKFGDNEEIEVEANTHIIYKEGVVRVVGKDKNFFYGDSEIKLNRAYVDLTGNKISCLDCKVGEVKLRAVESGLGLLTITDDGYFLNRGVADYKKIRLTAENERGSVLIANLDGDLIGYDKNWVKISDRSLEINSAAEKQINLEVLPGNELLNTFQWQLKRDENGEYLLEDNKLVEEIVPDQRDNLKFKVSNGDGLRVFERGEEGKIPILDHLPSDKEGSTLIENGRLNFKIENNELHIGVPKTIEESVLDPEAKFESVAFQLKSSVLKDHELRINSGNMYEILSPDEVKSPISFNSMGFRISDSIKDNLYPQSLDYLQIKYPDIIFYASPEGKGALYTEPSPQIIQMLNQWFEEDPRRLDYFQEVQFTEVFNSAAAYKRLMLGERAYDLYVTEQIRKIENPKYILTHEFEHEMDFHIDKNEENHLEGFIRTDEDARELLASANKQSNLKKVYFSAENYHKLNSYEGILPGFISEERKKGYEEYMKLPLTERNKVVISKYQNEIQEFEQEIYSALSKPNEIEKVKSEFEKISGMNERRQKLSDLIFNPGTEKLPFKQADNYLEEIASLTTEIDMALEDLKYDLEKTAGSSEEILEITNYMGGIQTRYFFLELKPTTGIEARIDWHGGEWIGNSEYIKKSNSLFSEVPYLEEEFEKYLASNPKTKKLGHIYSEVSVDTAYDIIHDDYLKLIRNRAAGELKQKLAAEHGVDFGELRDRYANEKGRRNYLLPKEEFLSFSKDDQELILISDAAFYLMVDSEYYEEEKGIVADPELQFLSELAFSLDRLRDGAIQKYGKEAAKERFSEEGGLPPLTQMFELEFLLKSRRLADNPIFASLSGELAELYDEGYGLPASYGWYNYGNSEKKYSGRYSEIASTYREQPIDVRRLKIFQGSPGQKSLFKLLTQIAFDAGKMDIDEFTQLLGQDTDGDGLGDLFCETENCIEYRCVEYKFLCCIEHPDSPNC